MKAKLERTLSELKGLGYIISLYSDYSKMIETNNINKASHISVNFIKIDDELEYVGKVISIPKREINQTTEYFISKLDSDKVYQNFSNEFNRIIKSKGFGYTSYPTSYGIGVCLIGLSKYINECKGQIESVLNELDVVFTTEYSDAHLVFRYKISKSKSNINRIKQIA